MANKNILKETYIVTKYPHQSQFTFKVRALMATSVLTPPSLGILSCRFLFGYNIYHEACPTKQFLSIVYYVMFGKRSCLAKRLVTMGALFRYVREVLPSG